VENYFSQLLNVHSVSDVKHGEIHTGEQLVPEPHPFEVEIVIAKLKYKSSDIDKILIELIQAGGETSNSEIRKFMNSIYK
jgi:hypothetical protein